MSEEQLKWIAYYSAKADAAKAAGKSERGYLRALNRKLKQLAKAGL